MEKWDREEAEDYLTIRFPDINDFNKELILNQVEADIKNGIITIEQLEEQEFEVDERQRYSGQDRQRVPAMAHDGTILEEGMEDEIEDLGKSIISA